jgi:S-adenosylmethionine uptake transporter
MTFTPSPLRGALLGLASFASYACCDVILKYLGQDLHTFQVMFCAAAFTLPFIIAQIVVMDRGASLKPVMPGFAAARIAITLVNSAFVTYTFTHLPLAQCYAIFFTMPLMITVLAWPLLGEPIDLKRGLIILVGFAGVLVAVPPGSTTLQFAHLTAICGATLGALNSLILRKVGGRERAGVMLLYPVMAQALGAACALPFVWRPMLAHDYVAATILGVLGTAGGLFIIAAYRRAPAIVVAPMQYSQILWASTIGYFLFGEVPGLVTLIGIAIIIGAGLVLLYAAGRSTRQESPV